MKSEEMKKRLGILRNYTGNAALCAILIMIMLLAIGTAVLVVTGRSSIPENDHMPNYTPVAESSSSEEIPVIEELEAPQALMTYPEKDFDFLKMDLRSVTSNYNVLLDITNNKMYTGKNLNKKMYPASLTKILTVIIALENCDDLSDTYKFTKEDMKRLENENASVAGFVAGEKVTVRDLLYGAMLPSGADATLGIANYIAGSEEAFVDMMNNKVEELGLTGTHFENASGLHDANHYTTALDMAMIVEYAVNNPDISNEFLKIAGAESYTTKKSNKNKSGITLSSIFFSRYNGFYIDRDMDEKSDVEIVGGKTGFTDEAKYALASIYKIGDNYYVCIVMKSDSAAAATEDSIKIAERYLPTFDLIGDVPTDSSSAPETDENGAIILDESKVDVTPSPVDQTESSSAADTDIATVIPDTTDQNAGTDQGQSTDQTADNGDLGIPIIVDE